MMLLFILTCDFALLYAIFLILMDMIRMSYKIMDTWSLSTALANGLATISGLFECFLANLFREFVMTIFLGYDPQTDLDLAKAL
jgi:hypothetical protein